jgi:hypothetical protein
MKAFSSVDWNFLFGSLGAMSFPMKFINWLKACITIPRYSIMINGVLCGFFEGRKGSRQGDPLSPYLFAIAMEVLSCMPNSAADNGVLSYNSRCSKIHLIHLCFADDLVIFTEGCTEAILAIKRILCQFDDLPGLKCNPAKREFNRGGINSDSMAARMKEVSGFNMGVLPVRYLGVPLITEKFQIQFLQASFRESYIKNLALDF